MIGEELTRLEPGQLVIVGGDRVVRVGDELAAAFRPGDRLVVVHTTGDLLHIPAGDSRLAAAAVAAAAEAFAVLPGATDEQITAFFDRFAALLEAGDGFAPIAAANADDVRAAKARGRSTTRLVLTEAMRAGMIAGLRTWRDLPARRDGEVASVDHGTWSVTARRAPLGVVGFVFEGRPNVFADATGVLRTGNTVVLRIGSDALRTARAIVAHVLSPALRDAGLPAGAVQLVDSAAHASGWALFSDRRLSLAVARGSGPAVTQLGAVARQHGIPASLHGTGGAWLVAGESADTGAFAAAVEHSLDRKVCNTLNVCCVVRSRAAELLPVFRDAAERAAAGRGTKAVIHDDVPSGPELGHEWEWEDDPEATVITVDSVEQAIELFNAYSPRFGASLISDDQAEQERFYAAIDAPFVGNGMTRWIDGQFALDQPELGLSNWQDGRLFGRGGILSGDSVYTVRLRAHVRDRGLHR